MTSNEHLFSSPPLTSAKIKILLSNEKQKYQVIEKESSTSTPAAGWWETFGYPAVKDENDKFCRIKGYISCVKCFHTFIYSSNSGTTRFKQHARKCSNGTSSITIESSNSSSTQSTLAQHGFKTSSTLREKDSKNIKKLCVQWICHDLRPFCTLEDVGFCALAQELIQIGHKYGVIDVNEVLRSRFTASRAIYDLADSYRQYLKQMLVEPLKARAVTICPDFWTDCYKNISYLGLNVTLVDSNYKTFSIDLFCRAFIGIKTSNEVLKALQGHLTEFGIEDLTSVNIVSDRGSNFVTAFRDFQPLFCFGHRLNNILKIGFFGNIKKRQKQVSTLSTIPDINSEFSTTMLKGRQRNAIDINDAVTSDDSSDDDEKYTTPTIPMKRKKRKKRTNKIESTNVHLLERKISINEFPIEAHNIIIAINQCKKTVKYIKKSGLNKDIESAGGGTVHQSIVIRWISMIESLESILRSFKIIKKVLVAEQQQKLINYIDEKTLKQIILLLKPFKHVIKLIQTGHSPSLYMVLLSIQTLREVMSSYQSLLDYHSANSDEQSTDGSKELDEDLSEELQGINFFWNRIRCLLNEMFTLDIRHYVATVLHPKYRSLKLCSINERQESYAYIRQELKLINVECNKTDQQLANQPVQKKFKNDLFSRFESGDFIGVEENEEEPEDTDLDSPRGKKTDEHDRYLNLDIDKSKLESNPLSFSKEYQDEFPRLSRYARSIHSIPATSASVERQFSEAGLIIQE
ncbi:unnamed protein product [Rotaria magnacalcarata]